MDGSPNGRGRALGDLLSGASFSNVPIINMPGKLVLFTFKIEVSIVLQLM